MSALFWKLAERCGIPRSEEEAELSDIASACSRIQSLSDDQKRTLAEELVEGLRGLPREFVEMNVFNIITGHLRPYWEELFDQSLTSALHGSPAGQELPAGFGTREPAQDTQSAQSTDLVSYEERREAEERAARERRDARRDARRQAGLARQAAMRTVQSKKNQHRRVLLAELESLDGAARLEWITSQPRDFPLDMIPADLIHETVEHGDVPEAVAADLVLRIGSRRGDWGHIRNLLRQSPSG